MYNIFRILIEVPDNSSSFCFFSKNEEEAIPPGRKKHSGTTKGSTRMILVHVQKMYKKTCYSSSAFFFQKMKRKLSPPEVKNI